MKTKKITLILIALAIIAIIVPIILTFALTTHPAHADSIDLYWYGGTGNWSSGTAHWSANSGNSPAATHVNPTASNKVIFDALSFSAGAQTVTVDATAVCKDMDWSAIDDAAVFTGTAGLTISGYLTKDSLMTWSYSGTLTFNATTGPKTITSDTKGYSGPVTFNGAGGSWQLVDTFNMVANTLTLSNGTLDTNGVTVTCGAVSITGATSTLTLGATTLNSSSSWSMAATSSLNCNTSIIVMSGAGITFTGGNHTYNELQMTGSGQAAIADANTYLNLTRVGTAIATDSVRFSANQTITGTFTLTGNSVANRLTCKSNTTTARILTSAANAVTNTDFYYINGAGAASWDFHLNPGGCADMGGNVDITFSPSFWIGGSGNWNDSTHWAGATGGTTHPNWLPTSATNDVKFDANSCLAGGQTITMNAVATCRDMDWTGIANNPTWAGTTGLTLYGNLTTVAPASLNRTYTGTITLAATSGTKTFTTNGLVFANNMSFTGIGGTWQLQDAFNDGANTWTLTSGTLDTNGQTLTCGTFVGGGGTNALTLGASTINCASFSANSIATVTCGTSVINITAASTFAGSGKTYYTVQMNVVGTLIITGSNTYTNLTRVGTAVTTDQITLTGATTQTITGTLTLTGNSTTNKLLVYSSNTTQATLSAATVAVTHCGLKYITGAGAGDWDLWAAGADCKNNYYTTTAYANGCGAGIYGINLFVPDAYWVNNEGGFNEASTHWASVSGGAPSANNIPGWTTNVHFDANSFTIDGQIVYDWWPAPGRQSIYWFVHDFDWTGALHNPQFQFLGQVVHDYTGGNSEIEVRGNFTLIHDMTIQFTHANNGSTQNSASIRFATTTSHTITTNGCVFSVPSYPTRSISIFINLANTVGAGWDIGGTWTLGDDFTTGYGGIGVYPGTFVTNGYDINTNGFSYAVRDLGGVISTLTYGTSIITCSSFTNELSGLLYVDTGNYTIIMNGSATTFAGNSETYYDVFLTGANEITTGSNTYHNLTRTGTAIKTESWVLSGDQTVTSTLNISGNSAINRVFVQSDVIGTARTLSVGATVTITHADFWDMIGAGAASWNISATDAGDEGANSGILFQTGATQYWVGNTGNWSDVSHWASSSGGTPASGRVPIPQDTARFDGMSFNVSSKTVTIDMPRLANITTTGVIYNPAFYSATTINCYKTLVLEAITWSAVNGTYLYNRLDTNLTSGAVTLTGALTVSAYGMTITLQDDLTVTGTLTLLKGTLSMNTHNVTAATFDATTTADTRALNMTSGYMVLNGTAAASKWAVAAANFTLVANTGTIWLTNSAATTQTFTGASLTTYHNIWIAGAGNYQMTFSGSNTIADLYVERTLASKTLAFTNGTTQTLSGFTATAGSTNVVTLTNTSSNGIWTWTKSSGVVYADYLMIKYSVVTGGAGFYCGTNSFVLDGTLSSSGGVVAGSPVSLYEGYIWSPNVTTVGTLTALLGSATLNGTASNHTGSTVSVTGSPKTLTAGSTTVTTTGTAPGLIDIVVTGSGWNQSVPAAPGVTTGVATLVYGTTATLNGTLDSVGVYPEAFCYFEYGLTVAYGSTTAEQHETVPVAYLANITGLTATTTYHFRAVARYNVFTFTYGADATLTTAGAPTITTLAASNIATTSARLNASLNDLGLYSTVYVAFDYGTSIAYGTTTAWQTYTLPSNYVADITGLMVYTTYHYRAVCLYGTGLYVYGSDITFETVESGIGPGAFLPGDNSIETLPESIVPLTEVTDRYGTPASPTNPLSPAVTAVAPLTGFTDTQLWLYLAIFITLILTGASLLIFRSHVLISGIVCMTCGGFFVSQLVFPYYTLILFGAYLICALVMERQQSL